MIPPYQHNEHIHPQIPQQLPEFVRVDHPTLVAFLAAYYEWMDMQTDNLLSPMKLGSVIDVDKTLDMFIHSFKQEYLLNFPEKLASNNENTPTDERKLIKNIKAFYAAKGTEKTYEFLFRILYDTNIEFYYPKKDILRLSDGKWIAKKSIKTTMTSGKLLYSSAGKNIIQRNTSGEVIASARVIDVSSYQVGSNTVAELNLAGINGAFVSGDIGIEFTDLDNITRKEYRVFSNISSVTIVSGGVNYKVGDAVIFTPTATDTGQSASGKVKKINASTGEIIEIVIDNFGVNYNTNPSISVVSFAGSGFSGTVSVGTLCEYAGYYANNDSRLSTNKVLQDNHYYQNFSYVLKTEVTVDKYRDVLRKLLHPAGMGFFGNILLKRCSYSNIEKSTSIIKYEVPLIGNYAAYTNNTYDNLSDWFGTTAGDIVGYLPSLHNSSITGSDGNPVSRGVAYIADNTIVGSLTGFGWNPHGALNFPLNTSYKKISANYYDVCMIKQDGGIDVYGHSYGTVNKPTTGTYTDISSTVYAWAAVHTDGSLTAWNGNTLPTKSVFWFPWREPAGSLYAYPKGNDFTQVAMGYMHGYGLKEDGTIRYWGITAGTRIPVWLSRGESITGGVGGWSSVGNAFGVTANPLGTAGSTGTVVTSTSSSSVAWNTSIIDSKNLFNGLVFSVYYKPISAPFNRFHLRDDTGYPYSDVYFTLLSPGLSSVSSGVNSAIGIYTNSVGLTAWGDNRSGQCNIPAAVGFTSGFLGIAMGASFGAAILSNGGVTAWGDNTYGQRNIPTGLTATAIAAGSFHTVAVIKTSKGVTAWGSNSGGQCNIPAGLSATAVAAGAAHSLALLPNGGVTAWGLSANGQCNIPAGLSATAIAAGAYHSLALMPNGGVTAWGTNTYGQTTIPAGLTATAIAAGGNNSAALRVDGSVVVWGDNTYGQTAAPAGLSATAISVGEGFVVAVNANKTAANSAIAWGATAYGQLNIMSDRTVVSSNIAYNTAGPANSSNTYCSYTSVAGISGGPTGWYRVVLSMGASAFNGLTSATRSVGCYITDNNPVTVGASIGVYGAQLDVGDASVNGGGAPQPYRSINDGLYGSQTVWPLQGYYYGQDGLSATCTSISPTTKFKQIGAGLYHNVGLLKDGSLTAWGYITTAPPTGNDFTKIAVGHYGLNLALRKNGSFVAWGPWTAEGTSAGAINPVGKTYTGTFKDIFVGYNHGGAIRNDGTALLFGVGVTDAGTTAGAPVNEYNFLQSSEWATPKTRWKSLAAGLAFTVGQYDYQYLGDSSVQGADPFWIIYQHPNRKITGKVVASIPVNLKANFLGSTNIIPYAINGSALGGWIVVNATVAGNMTGPDGTNTAISVKNVAVGQRYFAWTLPAEQRVSNKIYTMSVYAKAGSDRYLLLYNNASTYSGYAIIDLLTGAFTPYSSTEYISSSVSNAGNGWWRISLTSKSPLPIAPNTVAGALTWYVEWGKTGWSDRLVGDGSVAVYLWGAQLEEGSTLTTYAENGVGGYWPEWTMGSTSTRQDWATSFTGSDRKYAVLDYTPTTQFRKITARSFFGMQIGKEFNCKYDTIDEVNYPSMAVSRLNSAATPFTTTNFQNAVTGKSDLKITTVLSNPESIPFYDVTTLWCDLYFKDFNSPYTKLIHSKGPLNPTTPTILLTPPFINLLSGGMFTNYPSQTAIFTLVGGEQHTAGGYFQINLYYKDSKGKKLPLSETLTDFIYNLI